MLYILGEHKEDSEAVKAIVRLLDPSKSPTIQTKGYGGCPQLMRKAAAQIKLAADNGYTHFILVHDCDRNDPKKLLETIRRKVFSKTKTPSSQYCISIPVEELEAWLIADEKAITAILPTLDIAPQPNPESIKSPKEWLERRVCKKSGKRLYIHSIHNANVARNLDIPKVATKCPSVASLIAFGKHYMKSI